VDEDHRGAAEKRRDVISADGQFVELNSSRKLRWRGQRLPGAESRVARAILYSFTY